MLLSLPPLVPLQSLAIVLLPLPLPPSPPPSPQPSLLLPSVEPLTPRRKGEERQSKGRGKGRRKAEDREKKRKGKAEE